MAGVLRHAAPKAEAPPSESSDDEAWWDDAGEGAGEPAAAAGRPAAPEEPPERADSPAALPAPPSRLRSLDPCGSLLDSGTGALSLYEGEALGGLRLRFPQFLDDAAADGSRTLREMLAPPAAWGSGSGPAESFPPSPFDVSVGKSTILGDKEEEGAGAPSPGFADPPVAVLLGKALLRPLEDLCALRAVEAAHAVRQRLHLLHYVEQAHAFFLGSAGGLSLHTRFRDGLFRALEARSAAAADLQDEAWVADALRLSAPEPARRGTRPMPSERAMEQMLLDAIAAAPRDDPSPFGAAALRGTALSAADVVRLSLDDEAVWPGAAGDVSWLEDSGAPRVAAVAALRARVAFPAGAFAPAATPSALDAAFADGPFAMLLPGTLRALEDVFRWGNALAFATWALHRGGWQRRRADLKAFGGRWALLLGAEGLVPGPGGGGAARSPQPAGALPHDPEGSGSRTLGEDPGTSSQVLEPDPAAGLLPLAERLLHGAEARLWSMHVVCNALHHHVHHAARLTGWPQLLADLSAAPSIFAMRHAFRAAADAVSHRCLLSAERAALKVAAAAAVESALRFLRLTRRGRCLRQAAAVLDSGPPAAAARLRPLLVDAAMALDAEFAVFCRASADLAGLLEGAARRADAPDLELLQLRMDIYGGIRRWRGGAASGGLTAAMRPAH